MKSKDPKRVKAGKKSKTKGNNFERKVAKMLSQWWGSKFYRTPMSGGSKLKEGFHLAGDVVTDDLTFCFHTECFAKNTLVLTKKGYVPIEEIKVGDRVLTHTGNFRRVVELHRSKSNIHEIIHPLARDALKLTRNHPLETFDGGWIEAELANHLSHITDNKNGLLFETKNLYLAKYNEKTKKILESPVELDDDLLYLFGLYIADGHTPDSGVTWTINTLRRDLQESIIRIVNKKFGLNTSVFDIKNTLTTHVRVFSSQLRDTFGKLFGNGSRKKFLGEYLWLSKKRLRCILKGMWDGDGHFSDKDIVYSTVSRRLAYEVQIALFRLGIIARVGSCKNKNCKSDLFNVTVKRSCFNRWFSLFVEEKDPLDAVFNYGKQFHIVNDFNNHRLYSRNLSLRDVRGVYEVYNLSVEKDETFVVEGGVVVHNCKNQEGWEIEHLLTLPATYGKLGDFLMQACVEAPDNKIPLLIFTKNYQPEFFMLQCANADKHKNDLIRLGNYIVRECPTFAVNIPYGKGKKKGEKGAFTKFIVGLLKDLITTDKEEIKKCLSMSSSVKGVDTQKRDCLESKMSQKKLKEKKRNMSVQFKVPSLKK